MSAVRRAGLLAVLALALLGAAADDPAERLRDPAREARARALFREIRCLVCQNQSIDESEADLAGDLRRAVREKVAAGWTDAEVRRFIVDRYGEFALERPDLLPQTLLLWGTPFAAVLLGGGALLLARRRGAPAEPPLSPEEEAALAQALRSQGSAAIGPHEGP